jgi:hypothetical protein
MTNMVGDVPVVLRELVRNPDNAINMMIGMFGGTRIRVELPTHPDGFALDFVEITTDTREKPVKYGETWRSPFDRAVLLKSIPASVQTMDITWLVQKTRSVEFLVKPPKPE